jgi:hypothetical protein
MSLITAAATLGLASICTAGLGFAGVVVMWLLVPETLRRRTAFQANTPAPPGAIPPGAAEPARPRDRSE